MQEICIKAAKAFAQRLCKMHQIVLPGGKGDGSLA